jgi:hypothetical protein
MCRNQPGQQIARLGDARTNLLDRSARSRGLFEQRFTLGQRGSDIITGGCILAVLMNPLGQPALPQSVEEHGVIDYVREDFTKNGEAYDVIFDVAGKSPFARSIKSLKKGGRYILANPGLSHIVRGLWTSLSSGRKVIIGGSNYRNEDLLFLRELIEAGEIRPVVDRRYPLEQMAEAHRYVETGQKKGSVVIKAGHDDEKKG